jgi:hypothetical protein
MDCSIPKHGEASQAKVPYRIWGGGGCRVRLEFKYLGECQDIFKLLLGVSHVTRKGLWMINLEVKIFVTQSHSPFKYREKFRGVKLAKENRCASSANRFTRLSSRVSGFLVYRYLEAQL